MSETLSDAALARRIAEGAGRLLLALRDGGLFDGKALGTAGDRLANGFIEEALRRWRPEDAILSEESADDLARLACRRVWIVDPLDGTREYAEGRSDWAVHVALAVDGEAAAGAVALPGLGLAFCTEGVFAAPAAQAPPRILVSRSRPAAEAVALADRLGAELRPMGSAGAKAMAVVRGEAEAYLHSGGQYEWDNCAPVAVAMAAGLHASRLDGARLSYNRESSWSPDLLVCRPALAPMLLAALRETAG